jgi:hypothetical protein
MTVDPDIRARSAWYTPDSVADTLAGLAAGGWTAAKHRTRVLEPACGDGALIRGLLRAAPSLRPRVTAIDIAPVRSHIDGVEWQTGDFLAMPGPIEPYDLAILNPPYEGGLDSRFVERAMDQSLRVAALVRLALLESARSHRRIWSRVERGEWYLHDLAIYSRRPAFLPGGAPSDGGKTAFAIVVLDRRPALDGATSVSWVTP